MPTLADIQAATPKCERMMTRRHMGERCCTPLRYDLVHDTWRCRIHGNVATGAQLGERLVVDEADLVLPWLQTAKR